MMAGHTAARRQRHALLGAVFPLGMALLQLSLAAAAAATADVDLLAGLPGVPPSRTPTSPVAVAVFTGRDLALAIANATVGTALVMRDIAVREEDFAGLAVPVVFDARVLVVDGRGGVGARGGLPLIDLGASDGLSNKVRSQTTGLWHPMCSCRGSGDPLIETQPAFGVPAQRTATTTAELAAALTGVPLLPVPSCLLS